MSFLNATGDHWCILFVLPLIIWGYYNLYWIIKDNFGDVSYRHKKTCSLLFMINRKLPQGKGGCLRLSLLVVYHNNGCMIEYY